MYNEIVEENRKNAFKRELQLDLLLNNLEKHKQGRGKNLIIVGEQNIGKSFLIKGFISKNEEDLICLIDLSKISLTPEDLAVSFIANVSSWHLRKDIFNLDECKLGEKTTEIVEKVKNELLKIKPSHHLLCELAFSFAESLGEDLNRKITLCIDDFWKILDLNNFDQINDISAIFYTTIQKHKSTCYILISNAVYQTKLLNKNFNFEIIEIGSLRLHDIGDDEVHYYSNGTPLYATAIKARLKDYNAKESFLIETLWRSGVIYNSCCSILTDSLSRARGRGLLISILKSVYDNNGLRLTDISRKIYRSAPVTKNLITRLVEVDILVKDGKLFSFKDPILKFWFRHYSNASEFDMIPDKNTLKKIEVSL